MSNDLFEWTNDDSPQSEWKNMPQFNQPDNGAYRQIIVSFDDQEGVDQFAKLLDVNLTSKTKSMWYPPRDKNNVADLFWFSKDSTDE